MAENIVYIPSFGKTANPARCHVPSGVIEINNAVWPYLTDAQREFVLNHERGHRDLKTYDELKADNFALGKMALKKKESLWNHIQSVKSISYNNPQRVHNAELQALRIAAKNGSPKAIELLKKNGMYTNASGTPQKQAIGVTYYAVCLIVTIIVLILIIRKYE